MLSGSDLIPEVFANIQADDSFPSHLGYAVYVGMRYTYI